VKKKVTIEIELNVPELGINGVKELPQSEAKRLYDKLLLLTKGLGAALEDYREILPKAKPHGKARQFVLEYIKTHETFTMNTLRKALELGSSHVSMLCKQLENEGLIERKGQVKEENVYTILFAAKKKDYIPAIDVVNKETNFTPKSKIIMEERAKMEALK